MKNISLPLPTHYFMVIAACLGLLFALIDDSEVRSWWLQGILWQVQTIVPMFLLIFSHQWLVSIRRFGRQRGELQLLLSGFTGATLFVPLALLADLTLVGEQLGRSIWYELGEEWLNVTPPVIITWMLLNLPFLYGLKLTEPQTKHSQLESKESPEEEQERTSVSNNEKRDSSEFLSLAGVESIDQLIYLKSELHYLQVVTPESSRLILFRLKDAIDLLPNFLGIQCHRSFWVNLSYVEKFKRKGRQGVLTLSNGTEIPVSRSQLITVEQRISRENIKS